MPNLTLIIPAKNEAESLPSVLNELKNFDFNKTVILESSDTKTIESIKNFNCEILYQNEKGYGNALIQGINNVKTEYLCIFNADGSFDPKYMYEMLDLCKDKDLVFEVFEVLRCRQNLVLHDIDQKFNPITRVYKAARNNGPLFNFVLND